MFCSNKLNYHVLCGNGMGQKREVIGAKPAAGRLFCGKQIYRTIASISPSSVLLWPKLNGDEPWNLKHVQYGAFCFLVYTVLSYILFLSVLFSVLQGALLCNLWKPPYRLQSPAPVKRAVKRNCSTYKKIDGKHFSRHQMLWIDHDKQDGPSPV